MNWLKYILYSIILVLLHNIFVKYNFLSPKTKLYYSPRKLIPPLLNTLTFGCPKLFAGAMWFLPTLIFAITIFGVIVYWGRKISDIGQDEREKKIV